MRRRQRYEEAVEERRPRSWPWKAVGVLVLLVLVYWLVLGGGFGWVLRLSGSAGPTAKLSQTGEICVSGALPTSVSCGEACGTSAFHNAGWSFSCRGGQIAVLRDLRPNIPTTFNFPSGNITVIFPAVDVEVPLVQTGVVQPAKASTPAVIIPTVVISPTPVFVATPIPAPQPVAPPIRVATPLKPIPDAVVKQPIQASRTCAVELSFTVSAMFASSPCFSGAVEWGDGRVWHAMRAREVGPWYESNSLPPAGSRICFRASKKVYCAGNVEAGGRYTFTQAP